MVPIKEMTDVLKVVKETALLKPKCDYDVESSRMISPRFIVFYIVYNKFIHDDSLLLWFLLGRLFDESFLVCLFFLSTFFLF